jgi:hypothetical protein
MKIYCGDSEFLYSCMEKHIDVDFHKYMMPFEEFKHSIESHSIVIVSGAIFMLNISVLSDRIKALMKGEIKPIVIDFLNNNVILN